MTLYEITISCDQANLLVNEKGEVRISDFGLVAVTESHASATSFSASADSGSVRWLAPEHFDHKKEVKKNRKTDSYAFAMTLFEVSNSEVPELVLFSNDIIVGLRR